MGLALAFLAYAIPSFPFRVLRGTNIPFWVIVVALGVILIIYDAVKARRAAKNEGDGTAPPP